MKAVGPLSGIENSHDESVPAGKGVEGPPSPPNEIAWTGEVDVSESVCQAYEGDEEMLSSSYGGEEVWKLDDSGKRIKSGELGDEE